MENYLTVTATINYIVRKLNLKIKKIKKIVKQTKLLFQTMMHGLTNESIIFKISCWIIIVFLLNLVHKRFKYVTAKYVCKRYPPLLTSYLIELLDD